LRAAVTHFTDEQRSARKANANSHHLDDGHRGPGLHRHFGAQRVLPRRLRRVWGSARSWFGKFAPACRRGDHQPAHRDHRRPERRRPARPAVGRHDRPAKRRCAAGGDGKIPSEGNYNITTDGKVNGYIDPRLAFGHGSAIGFLVWVFVGLFVVGLIGSIVASKWLGRVRRNAVPAAGMGMPGYEFPVAPLPSVAKPAANTVVHEPSDEGVRLERLKTIAALRDSGALTEAEFEAEKRKILDGD
jgi:hypothetical protein